MAQTDEGRSRLEAHDDRTNRGIAERIEHHELRGPREAQEPQHPREFIDVNGQHPDQPELRERPRPHRGDRQVQTRQDQRGEVHVQPQEQAPAGVRGSMGDPAEEVPTETPVSQNAPHRVSEEIITQDDMEADGGNGTGAEQADVEMDFIGNCEVIDELGSLEPSVDDVVSSIFLQELGASAGKYKRETRRGMRAIVSEIYSPPRVTEMIAKGRHRHVLPGVALDITVNDPLDGRPWDFNIESKRRRARQIIREQKPYCLIGSPMCTAFCTWQALNEARSANVEEVRRSKVKAIVHMDFVAGLYAEQVAGGRYFLHEHPDGASSWSLPSIEAVRQLAGVQRVRGDQCQYGAEVNSGPYRGDPIMKPSGFMTNSAEIASCLSARCQGQSGACSRPNGGFHRLCSGRLAREAATYPPGLCRAVLRGIRNQMKEDGMIHSGCYGVQVDTDE